MKEGPGETLPALSCALCGAAVHDFGVSWAAASPRALGREKNASPRNKITPPPQTFGLCGWKSCNLKGVAKEGVWYALQALSAETADCKECKALQRRAIMLHRVSSALVL